VWSLGLAATIVLSFHTARYRAPIVFFGCIWVAHAVALAWRCWHEGRRSRLAAGAGVVLALAVVLGASAVPQRGFPPPIEWDEAMALASTGALDEAVHWIERALERAPDDPSLKLGAAAFFHKHGMAVEEQALLRQVLALPDPEPDLLSVGHHRLARSYAAEGRIDDARREIEAALAVEVDATDWRGHPYYRLELGPVTACWLRLEAAGMEFDAGDPVRGVALTERARADCPIAGRLESRLVELEARSVLAAPHLEPAP
jgi:tetratricopeptide (TPR) repeat protein